MFKWSKISKEWTKLVNSLVEWSEINGSKLVNISSNGLKLVKHGQKLV
jgi:hypothetical protein